jgi:hypothetical protein
MQAQSLKQETLDTLQQMPDDEIMYRIYVIDKLRKSRLAIQHDGGLSHEDLKREIEQW